MAKKRDRKQLRLGIALGKRKPKLAKKTRIKGKQGWTTKAIQKRGWEPIRYWPPGDPARFGALIRRTDKGLLVRFPMDDAPVPLPLDHERWIISLASPVETGAV